MKLFSIPEILKATHGKLISGPRDVSVEGVSINSRTVKPNDLFVAIKGQHFDAHDFALKAVQQGAVAVIISKPIKGLPANLSVIRVKDTTLALGHLARAHRNRFQIPVIAITGSAGKTTTKEFVAAVLQSRFNVLKNVGTENNQIGVPMTIFKLSPLHKALVLEVGTNRFGDIPWLTYVAYPTVAIFTNIGESHLAILKSPEHVLKEKFALVKGMQPKGRVIINVDNPYLRKKNKTIRNREVITYGAEQPSDFQASEIRVKTQELTFTVNGCEKIKLASPVTANVHNALAAISCGRMFNIPYNNIKKSIKSVQGAGGRQAIGKYGSCWLINDTYNANPVSFRSALQTLTSFDNKGRRILICADMLELGKEAKSLHAQIGILAARLGVDAIFAFGQFTQTLVEAAKKQDMAVQAKFFKNLNQLNRQLKTFIRRGDLILVKGSRGMHLERTVEYLQGILPKLR